ncbi:MAG: exosortase [Rhizobiales bacterium]|nr:exosortase [Hyphomicrobiales bacterium]
MTDLSLPRLTANVDAQKQHMIALIALSVAVLAAFIPTGITLNAGPWQTEQEGHGPFILGIAAWIVWTKRAQLQSAVYSSAPVSGWIALLGGLALLFVGRSQNILAVETFSALPILTGVVLLTSGWGVLRILWFPIAVLFFAVPPPQWLMDSMTLPLKAMISNAVTRMLYWAGYPIAQNGVVIMIGPYQLLVKDACAGLNSIFALSAIGVVYVYIMEHTSKLRNIVILLAIFPITVLANFVRVAALVLIAYHFGTAAVEGFLHEMTGIALFAVSFVLVLLFDGLLAIIAAAFHRMRRPAATGGAALAK